MKISSYLTNRFQYPPHNPLDWCNLDQVHLQNNIVCSKLNASTHKTTQFVHTTTMSSTVVMNWQNPVTNCHLSTPMTVACIWHCIVDSCVWERKNEGWGRGVMQAQAGRGVCVCRKMIYLIFFGQAFYKIYTFFFMEFFFLGFIKILQQNKYWKMLKIFFPKKYFSTKQTEY